MVDSIVDLQRFAGLTPATKQLFKLDAPRRRRVFAECVISQNNPLNGVTIKEGNFRKRYNAVVLAVSRNGERINEKVGDIRLHTGDILLIESPPEFVEKYRYSNDFFLVTTLTKNGTPDYERSRLAWSILGGMVLSATFGFFTMFQAVWLATGLMMITRCCSVSMARSDSPGNCGTS